MTDILYFSRDTKVFMEIGSTVWEIPVLDGFSFSQATNASEITLNEMADSDGNSRRARQMFTDSYAPAEWSFSTYARPFKSAGTNVPLNASKDGVLRTHAVEEVLWALMVGDGSYTATDDVTAPAFTGLAADAAGLDITFANSNKTTLGTANIYFVMGGAKDGTKTTYKVEKCCVNEASLDFDIDGIATINWSGMGSIITEATAPNATVTEAVTSTDNFIRNRLTKLSVTGADDGTFAASYNLVLTGGSVTISNNMTFLTPETIGIVNQPIGHVTGTRSISGSFTCYLNANGTSSAELFEDIIEAQDTITNSFALEFAVGGDTSGSPHILLNMGACHLEVPSHSIEDVISLETTFHALPSNVNSTDELTIKYVAA